MNSLPLSRQNRLRFAPAFTLIELMIAIGILALIVAAIFSSWTAILRSAKVGKDAAAAVQRARIAIRTIEDSLGSAQCFVKNAPYYSFLAENGGEPSLSFVARLEKSFPRGGKFGDLDVRRLTFTLEPGDENSHNLVLRQNPIIMDVDPDEKNHPLVLAKNVQDFSMQFWDTRQNDWIDEWTKTNELPKLVMLTLKLSDSSHSHLITEEITRIVNLPAVAVQPGWQMPMGLGGPGGPGQPGGLGQPGQPGVPPNGGIPPGAVQPGSPGYPGGKGGGVRLQ